MEYECLMSDVCLCVVFTVECVCCLLSVRCVHCRMCVCWCVILIGLCTVECVCVEYCDSV